MNAIRTRQDRVDARISHRIAMRGRTSDETTIVEVLPYPCEVARRKPWFAYSMQAVRCLVLLVITACGNNLTKEIEELADRACACVKKNDINFSVDSLQAATDARISGTNRAATCAQPLVAEITKLAERNKDKPDDARLAAVHRLEGCLAKSGVAGGRALDMLRAPDPAAAQSSSSRAAEAVAKMEVFAKSVCECKDKACADKVQEQFTKLGIEMAKTGERDAKPDRELARKSADIMTKYTECMTRLMR